MELDNLIVAWKKQDENIIRQLQNDTLKQLLKQKSQGALSNIKTRLTWELALIIAAGALFNVLFILVNQPGTALRWGCFTLFNIIALWFIYYYVKAAFTMFTLQYNKDLRVNLEKIVTNLNRFVNQYKLLNLPVVFLCIIIFAGSQNIFVLAPWMIIEFLIWRSILLPKLKARFEGYKADVEYSLRGLQELED